MKTEKLRKQSRIRAFLDIKSFQINEIRKFLNLMTLSRVEAVNLRDLRIQAV